MRKAHVLFAAMILAGAVLWNGWVLGFYNHGLAGYLHMSISELEVVGQTHASLFNFLEDVSGILMLVGAIGTILAFNRRINVLLLILICIGMIGALTLYDVAHPLDCNSYDNPVCISHIQKNHLSQTDVLHNDESRLTAYITIILAVLIVIWEHLNELRRAENIGLITIAVAVIGILIVLDTNGNILVDAVAERIWNVLVSVAIGYVAVKLLKHRARPFRY